MVERAEQNVKNVYPLSPMQEGMLFHFLADRNSTAYFQQISWRICGDFDEALFETCWNELVRRHDILRTLFVYTNTDRPLQVVLKERKIHIHSEDLRALGNEARDMFIRRFKADDRVKTFDLSRDILLRVSTLRLGESDHEVLISHHHIIMDGWSMGVLVR
ncbi:MAG: condensation domain-containing protein, partial [Pseudomonadota bacterium]